MPTPRSGSDRLDAFFTAAPAGLAILDRELRYTQINETLALMNGRPVADHLGKSVREVLPTIAVTLEPLLQRILETGEPALNIELSGETPAQPGVTRYWRASLFPLAGAPRRRKSDRNGGAGGIGAIVVEDTPRRHAERALRRSGADYRAIVEQATYGIYRSSLEGRFLKVKPALVTMLGYDSEAQVLALELDRVVKSEKGDVRGFEMIAEDVTEQHTLERALQQAQKMETIGRLTSGIAHDFNNLLTVILAQSNLIAKALPSQPPPELR